MRTPVDGDGAAVRGEFGREGETGAILPEPRERHLERAPGGLIDSCEEIVDAVAGGHEVERSGSEAASAIAVETVERQGHGSEDRLALGDLRTQAALFRFERADSASSTEVGERDHGRRRGQYRHDHGAGERTRQDRVGGIGRRRGDRHRPGHAEPCPPMHALPLRQSPPAEERIMTAARGRRRQKCADALQPPVQASAL